MLADDSEQNTDRDMSSAAIDSLVGENDLGDHIGEVHLNEILDTLISEELRGINEYAEDANQDDNNDEEEGERRRIIRDNVVVYESRLSSLKRFKEDVREVQTGFECGIMVENFNDLKVGDILENYVKEEVAAKLE